MSYLDQFWPFQSQTDEKQIYKGLIGEKFDPTPRYAFQYIVLVFPPGWEKTTHLTILLGPKDNTKFGQLISGSIKEKIEKKITRK